MAGQRKCGACGTPGHTRRTCPSTQPTSQVEETVPEAPVERHDQWCLRCRATGHLAPACPVCEPVEEDFEDPSLPEDIPRKLPPVIFAEFAQECDTCDMDISEGDLIRATGDGGWECEFHAEEGQARSASPVPAPAPAVVTGPLPPSAPLPFGNPVPPAIPDFEDPSPAVQKRSETNNRGYLAKDPTLGDFRRYKNGNIKPITRVSTFIKAGSDRTALTDWNMRNVLLGCAHFPGIAAQAKVLHPNPEGPLPEDRDTKKELDRIVDDVSERVGSKRAANEGTNVHQSIEKYARGEWGYDDMPTHHVPWVEAFVAELDRKGLELVPDLVECTIYVPQFGGVMGRFDQALREKRTGRVLMSDVKTGSLDYAWREIQGQLAMYEAGYRQHGTYVWHPTDASQDRWEDPKYTLDQDEGLVIHLPVKSGQPSCAIYRVDLAEGRDHVKLCAQNREAARNAPKPQEWGPAPAPEKVWHVYDDGAGATWGHPGLSSECELPECRPAPDPGNWNWEPRFRMVQSKAEASGLWQSVTSAGVAEDEIRRLVAIARSSLIERGLWS